jgi:hypothetical protein
MKTIKPILFLTSISLLLTACAAEATSPAILPGQNPHAAQPADADLQRDEFDS